MVGDMILTVSEFRRLFVGKEVGTILAVLLAGSLLISGGFVPAYLAVLLASGVRNVYLSWLGSGVLFYAVAFFFLYLQAVVLTAIYYVLRRGYQTFRKQPRNGVST